MKESQGEYKINDDYEYVKCNYCSENDTRVVITEKTKENRGYCDVVRCNKCGLIYRNPRLRLSSERSVDQKRSDFPMEPTFSRMAVFEECLKEISGFRQLNRMLDVGSGKGYFLKLCSDNGWSVCGVEIDASLVEFTHNEFGIQVINAPLAKARFPRDYFDVVTFINVLEHCHDPSSTLDEAYKILRPGGAVLIRTPNAALHVNVKRLFRRFSGLVGRLKRLDLSVIYIYAYDRRTIGRLLSRRGFGAILISNASLRGNNIIKIVLEPFINLIGLLSGGRLLLAPSLYILATKRAG